MQKQNLRLRLEHLEKHAIAQAGAGNWEAAIRAFRRIVLALPNHKEQYINLLAAITASSKIDGSALLLVNRAKLLNAPNNARLRYVAGLVQFWNGHLGAAELSLQSDGQSLPDKERVTGLLARVASWRHRWGVGKVERVKAPDVSDRSSLALFVVSDRIGLDHIAPIAWAWTAGENNFAILLILDSEVKLSDFRISALTKRMNVQVLFVANVLDHTCNIQSALGMLIAKGGERVIVFDNTDNALAEIIRTIVHRHGARFLGVMHGEEPYVNLLTNEGSYPREKTREGPERFYDGVGLSSDFPISKYGFRSTGFYRIIGSQRYCEEWLAILEQIRPKNVFGSGAKDDKALRIVLFLPKPGKIVNWDELGRTIRLIAHCSGYHLVVKDHPRKVFDGLPLGESTGVSKSSRLTTGAAHIPRSISGADLGDGSVYELLDDDTESSDLLAWGDVFLALGTSVVFEAVVRNLPVLELSWCHGNLTTLAQALPETDMRSRDQCLGNLGNLKETGSKTRESFYDATNRKAFLSRFIQPSQNSVLDDWVFFLKENSTGNAGTTVR